MKRQFPTKTEVLRYACEVADLIPQRSGGRWADYTGITYGKRQGAVEAATMVERHFVSLGYIVEHRLPGPISNGAIKFLGRIPEEAK